MTHHFRPLAFAAPAALLLPVLVLSQRGGSVPAKPAAATSARAKIRRAPDGHPDLSGMWTFAIDLPPGPLTKVVDGKVTTTKLNQAARHRASNDVPGALPWTKAPEYKPEFQEKVKYLSANESKLDSVFYCAKPGVPRIGSPRKIVQLPKEMIFLYEDISGDPYRIIPTDGRKHRENADPTYYGDAVGHWEGDTLVVDSTNFVEDTWFGENGYFHSDKMHVIERLWLTPDNDLAYQATVDDPGVLAKPWTDFARVVPPAPPGDTMDESPPCKDDDGDKLRNLDHHLQR